MDRLSLAVLLGFLAALAPLSTDMYLPALPTMDAEFAVGTSLIQMTLTTTMVGMALGQLFAGPVSDCYGRRLPLVIGMALFALSTLGCMLAKNIYLFLGYRFVQGLAGSFGIVVSRAIARDVFRGSDLTRFISLLMLVNGFAPILAPVIGGQILLIANWRLIFAVLALVGLGLMLSCLWFTETLPPEQRQADLQQSFRIYRGLLRDRYFGGHCLIQCTSFAAFFAYISGSPFLIQNIYQLSPQIFSLIFGGLGLCMVISGLIPMRLAGRISEFRMLAWAVRQALAGSVLFLLCVLFTAPLPLTLLSLLVLVSTMPVCGAVSFSLCMRYHGREAGAASALFGFSSMAASGPVAPLVGLWGGETALPMALIMITGELLTLWCFWYFVYLRHRRGARLSGDLKSQSRQ